ncbi:polyketide synthase [Aspergillus pseudoustus]|uniref:Polyketide synthase n=1 Tax=Aspergillus pseudoustus TaxID=1810923 RepID=A0ABR4J3I4_9EURO
MGENIRLNGVANDYKTIPIAIIGMSCRFAGGVDSPESLWGLISQGRSAWSEIPKERYNQDAFYHPDPQYPGAANVKGGYFLQEDISLFDPAFFGLAADITAALDPQLRLLLEVTYEAFESAGLPLSKIAGTNAAVFVASFVRDYHDLLLRDPLTVPRQFPITTLQPMLANRISHFFDLRGPSTPVDTGCSGSLTALHLAVQSLRNGDAGSAVVGGACLCLSPDMFSSMNALGVLGPDGKCFSFDHRAQGYGRGEGVATIILKRLDDALAAGDPIRAVIRETTLNQDGKTLTLTSPSAEAQVVAMKACYARAGLDPLATSYLEAHGTGTPTGDPIEISAAGEVLGAGRDKNSKLLVGSIKANIGHTEAASGMSAVIKVVMALEKGKIPPNINFEKPNPKCELERWNLEVVQELNPWEPTASGTRQASINNFGYGGSNAHVIIDDSHLEYTALSSSGTLVERPDQSRVYVLSAHDEHVLNKMKSFLKDHLMTVESGGVNEEAYLADLAYTLSERRSRLSWTLAVPAKSKEELCRLFEDPSLRPTFSQSSKPRVGFVFTGQGAQWYAMGRELLSAYPVFAHSIQEADAIFQDLGAAWSCLEQLSQNEMSSLVDKPEFSFPLSCIIQVALVRLLRSWGIAPDAVTGHSSGEVAAAYSAGALDFCEALAIVYFRGKLTAEYIAAAETRGAMLAVGLGVDGVRPYLERISLAKVIVACINSSQSVTLSGDLAGIEEVEQSLTADGVFARRLRVEAAYHSHHMLAIKERYREVLSRHLHRGEPRSFEPGVVFSSPVTGTVISNADELGATHWVENMLQPVLFEDCLRNICLGDGKVDILVEVGPHGALAGPIRQCLTSPSFESSKIIYGSCLTRNQDAVQTVQQLVCSLLVQNVPVNLLCVNFPTTQNETESHTRSVLHELPTYPWNHTKQWWAESRTSLEHRLRTPRYHDLLGVRVPGVASAAAIWRLTLSPSLAPWIREHRIQSDIVYPAAGSIVMAVEAIRQVASETGTVIDGYLLEEVEIMRPLLIPETDDSEGVEVQLVLLPPDESNLVPDRRAWHIYYSSSHGGDWTEICRGLVTIKSGSQARSQLSSTSRMQLSPSVNSSPHHHHRYVQPSELFAKLRGIGVHHGPLFQNMRSIRSGEGNAIATFEVSDTASVMPARHQEPHVIHPITLDSVFQGVYGALSVDAQREVGAAIPRSIRKIYISDHIGSESGLQFKSYSCVGSFGSRGFNVDIAMTSAGADFSRPVLEVEGMYYQSLGAGSTRQDSETLDPLCLKIDWREHLDLCEVQHIKDRVLRDHRDQVDTRLQDDLTRAAFHIIHDALDSLTERELDHAKRHHPELYAWMLQVQEQAAANELARRSERWAQTSEGIKEMLFDRVRTQSLNGKVLVASGPFLEAFLRGQSEDALSDGTAAALLQQFHDETVHSKTAVAQCAELMDLYAHGNPRAKILGIGAGSATTAEAILQALVGDDGIARLTGYTLAHSSADALNGAKERLGLWGNLVSYHHLSLEGSADEELFGQYDFVVSTHLGQSTQDKHDSIWRARSFLKDGGKLIMLETAVNPLDAQVVETSLSGRRLEPNAQGLHEILHDSGFTGIDIELADNQGRHIMSLVVSTAVRKPTSPAHTPQEVTFVYTGSQPPEEWAGKLTDLLGLRGVGGSFQHLSKVQARNTIVVFLSGLDGPDLSLMDPGLFEATRQILASAKSVLWVTRGASIECVRPENALHSGLLRSCRCEEPGKRYVSLDLDSEGAVWTSENAALVARVLRRTLSPGGEKNASLDYEYAVRGGLVMVPRLRYDDSASEEVSTSTQASLSQQPEAELQPFRAAGRDIRMYVQIPGSLDSMVFKDNTDKHEEALPDGFIEIKAEVFGVNFRDVMVALGQLEVTNMGFECAGTVTRVGASAAAHFQPGDRVAALTDGHYYGTRKRIPWTTAVKIPDSMSYTVAASIPMAFATAYYGLIEVAGLQEGETVLIHAASGAVGQAAIMLAQWKKAIIYATVGSQEKRDLLTSTYNIPDSHIFSSRDVSFGAGTMAATNGQGVDVALNSLAGPLLHETWSCMASCGRFVEVGKRDAELNKRLDMKPFQRAVSFTALDLLPATTHRPLTVSRVLGAVMELHEKGVVKPVGPISVFGVGDIERAFRAMAAGRHVGKFVVKINDDDKVKVLPTAPAVKLSADASYLLVGGLGGIGRSIIRRLIKRGAKNLIVLSRSAANKPGTHEIVKEYQDTGCRIAVRNCDVADPEVLKSTLTSLAETMPSIRGVIQAAMVLQDVLFEKMTFTQWHRSLSPKLLATQNLHQAFSDASSLDFFIMLSSLMSVTGNAGQANYAAGGAYQDALARHRCAAGLPATTINLGMVQSVGVLTDDGNQQVTEQLQRFGHKGLDEEEVLRLIETAIRDPCPAVLTDSQIVTAQTVKSLSLYNWGPEPRFEMLRIHAEARSKTFSTDTPAAPSKGKATIRQSIAQKPADEANNLVVGAIAGKIAGMFALPEGAVNTALPLGKLGVDSLVAVELRNWLVAQMQCEMSVFEVMGSNSLVELAGKLVQRVR